MISFFNAVEPVAPVWNKLVERLVQNQHDVRLVIGSQAYRGDKTSALSEHIDPVWVPGAAKKARILGQLCYSAIAPFKILFARSSLNIFFTQPPMFFALGAIFSRLRRTPYIVHIMDMQPDLLVALGILREDSFVFRALNRFAIMALSNADRVVVIGRCMESVIRSKNIRADAILRVENISVLDDPISDSNGSGIDVLSPVREKHTADPLIVLYCGNMGRVHEFNTILAVCSRLSENSGIQFVFVGSGFRRNEVEEFVSSNDSANITLFDHLSDAEFSSVCHNSDIHFISLREPCTGFVVPSKFYSSLAAGKPVIFEGGENCELAMEIEQHGIGKHVNHHDTEGLEKAITEYANDHDLIRQQSENAKKLFRDKYRADALTDRYFQEIVGTMNNRTGG